MAIECRLDGQTATIICKPRGATREPYKPRAEVKRALSHKVTEIALDLSNVRELGNDELLDILACHLASVKAGVRMVVRNCEPALADLMRRSGVGNVVKIEDSPGQG